MRKRKTVQKAPLDAVEKEKSQFVRHVYEPKNKGQKALINSIRYNDITIAMGPPGVGKTIAAVSYGCERLLEGSINRIVFTRPTVYQGKGIGFLPGSMEDKMNPYMIPMYEVLKKYFTPLELTTIYTVGTSSYKSSPKIELVPFDFMRGLNWSKGDYVVLDEAQNATYEQIYTLITRLCDGAKIIMCGDLSQRDVDIQNGIEYFIPKLEKIQGVGVVELTEQDIVRHRIVQEIVKLLKKS